MEEAITNIENPSKKNGNFLNNLLDKLKIKKRPLSAIKNNDSSSLLKTQ